MKNFPNDFKQADLFDARIHIGGMHGPLVPLAPTRMTVLNKFYDGMEVIPDRRSVKPSVDLGLGFHIGQQS